MKHAGDPHDDPPTRLVLAIVTVFVINGLLLLPASLCFGAIAIGFFASKYTVMLAVSWLLSSLTNMGCAIEILASGDRKRLIKRKLGLVVIGLNGILAISALALLPRRNNGDVIVLACVAAVAVLNVVCLALINRAKQGKPGICSVCGYDLRGMHHAVCPECGKPVTTRVSPRNT